MSFFYNYYMGLVIGHTFSESGQPQKQETYQKLQRYACQAVQPKNNRPLGQARKHITIRDLGSLVENDGQCDKSIEKALYEACAA